MTAISINHVSIHAQDLERSAAFYEQLFGMQRIPTPAPQRGLGTNPKENDMHATEDTTTSPRAEHTGALLRHFADLRDGSHGGTTSRRDKERLFAAAVALLDPYARQALDEINAGLLRDTGEITSTGVRRSATAGLNSVWALSWPQQRAARIKPITIRAYFGIG